MSGYGWCYSAAPTACSGKAQPGTRILRDTMDDLVPELGDSGIYNCRPSSGGGGSLSRHANGTAWDAGTPSSRINTLVGQFFVDAARMLGVQRVICFGQRFDGTFGPREWDAREGERRWEPYGGPSEHRDHAHVELCFKASQQLTAQQVIDAFEKHWPGQEDDMTPEQDERLKAVEKALYKSGSGGNDEHLNRIDNMLTALGRRLTPPLLFNADGTTKA